MAITILLRRLVGRLRPLHTEALIAQLRIVIGEKGYSFFSVIPAIALPLLPSISSL
ncbi:hypothetical protein [Capnocytophaga granulosa]|uniref:hypothetical protein n=1 Tax=Capnocytophaga granulosa TaxID=45242 RepID=UPI001FCFC12E|nr:hypothetical protein [Capnocytophaga granulosa]